jgi:hypothetical protein
LERLRSSSSFRDACPGEPTAEALHGQSQAAWCLDDAETMFETREGAYRVYRRNGESMVTRVGLRANRALSRFWTAGAVDQSNSSRTTTTPRAGTRQQAY